MLDRIKEEMMRGIEFNTLLGVEICEVEVGRGVARLVQQDTLTNHLKLMHASALFAVAEAASGAAAAGTFSSVLEEVRLVAVDAQIKFQRPARSDVSAEAITRAAPSELLERLKEENRLEFLIDVSVKTDKGSQVAQVSVTWLVSHKKA